jgi:hypothetical protein
MRRKTEKEMVDKGEKLYYHENQGEHSFADREKDIPGSCQAEGNRYCRIKKYKGDKRWHRW